MENQTVYHIGTNEEVSIRHLAETIAQQMGVEIRLVTSPRRAGGTPRRCPEIARLQTLGYEPQLSLVEGLPESIDWYSAWADANP